MTGRSILLFVTLLYLPTQILAWDQLNTTVFHIIFPFVDTKLCDQLTYAVNRQNTTKQSIQVLNDWIDQNWVSAPISSKKHTTTTRFPVNHGRLVEKEHTRAQAIGFLEYRAAIRQYIRFIFRTTQIFEYLNQTDAELLRAKFWEADRREMNDWKWAQGYFFQQIQNNLGKTHPDVVDNVRKCSEMLKSFPGISEKLNYRLIR